MDIDPSELGYTAEAIERLKKASREEWLNYVYLLRDGDNEAASRAYKMKEKYDAQLRCLQALVTAQNEAADN